MNDPTATAPVVSTIIGTSTSVAVGFSSITTTRRSMNKSTMESTGKTVNTRSNNNSNKNHSKLAAVELITNEQTNIPYKLNPVSTSRDFYREPVLTRVAADLRNSPIASDSLSVLHTTDHLVVASDPTDSKLKRKYPDILTTSPSSSSPIQYQTVIISDNSGSSSSISSIGSSKEKRKKKSSRKHSSSLVSMNEDDIIATVVSDNNDSDAINKNSNNAGNTELPHYPSIEVKSNPFSLSNELQSIMHTVPSTSNTNNIVQMAFNDFRSLLYDALHKLEEKCDILAESTSDNDINLGSTRDFSFASNMLRCCRSN
ncbi:unnamed protein product [Heterobilharzia americana]|nr:unnamed protein product [Heterobilharzia americana]